MIDLYNDSFQNFHAQNGSTLFSHNLFKHGLNDLLHANPNQEKKLENVIHKITLTFNSAEQKMEGRSGDPNYSCRG